MNLTRIFKRTPDGVPTGGQFAHDTKAEPGIVLSSPPPPPAPPLPLSDELSYGDETPYGLAQPVRTDVEAEGIEPFRSIQYDGNYVRLSEERNAAIPEEYRNENRFYGDGGYTHKATELDVVIVTHPDGFLEEDLERAKDLIAVRDAPADIQKDLSEVRMRASISRDQGDRLREALEYHQGAERKWAASAVASAVIESFPQAKEVTYVLHGDNLIVRVSVSDGENTLGSLSMNPDGTVTGTGNEAGQESLHTAVKQLEDVPDTWMAEQGADVSPADSNGERTVRIGIASVLDKAAERVREADARR